MIDVRKLLEYASGHITGSLNVPPPQPSQPAGPLVLVCQSGILHCAFETGWDGSGARVGPSMAGNNVITAIISTTRKTDKQLIYTLKNLMIWKQL